MPPAETTPEPTQWFDIAVNWLVNNGLDFGMKLVGAIVILLIAKIVIGVICSIIEKALAKSGKVNDLLQKFLVNMASKSLWVLVWLIVLSTLGIPVGPLIASVGVMGFIVGFAFQDSLSNFAAGLMLLANAPFHKGHFVEVAGHAGTVQELNIMATTLTTPDNKRITIPNKAVWGQSIINYSVTGTRRVDMTVGISYSSDINKAKEVLMGLLQADERIMKDPAPVVEVVAMADSSVNFVVRPWTATSDYWAVYFAMQQKIKEAFDAADIEIPFPQRVVHMVNAPAA